MSKYSEANVFCRDRDRPVPVLSNAVPLASPLRSKNFEYLFMSDLS